MRWRLPGRRTLALTWHAALSYFGTAVHRVLTLNSWFRDGQPDRFASQWMPGPKSTVPIGTAPTVSPAPASAWRLRNWSKRIADGRPESRNVPCSRAANATAKTSRPKPALQADVNRKAKKEPMLGSRQDRGKTSMHEPRNVRVDVARGRGSLSTNSSSRAHVERIVPRRATGSLDVAVDARTKVYRSHRNSTNRFPRADTVLSAPQSAEADR